MIELNIFLKHLNNICPDFKNKKFLLAISGGIDSMVMFHLFHCAKLNIAIAHVNFQLRDAESERDMNFVFETAHNAGYTFFYKRVDTKSFSAKNKLNIQDAARKLRYDFFKEIACNNNFDFICTAHNRDDVIETLLMGLNKRGSLSTLAGIREIENKLMRPMLNYSRDEIEDYAAANYVLHVEDSSNISDKYLRNKIRHHLIPILEELMPGFSKRAADSVSFLRQHHRFFSIAAKKELNKIGDPEKEGLDLFKLKENPSAELLLMDFLLNNGFFPAMASEILNFENHSEPRKFLAPAKTLFVHRGKIILKNNDNKQEPQTWYIDEDLDTTHLPMKIECAWATLHSKEEVITDDKTVFVCADEIMFPLFIRKWQAGERFMPLGMSNLKKIGDYFTDIKATIAERDNAYIMYSGIRPVWLMGYRLDERFRIKKFPSRVLMLKLL